MADTSSMVLAAITPTGTFYANQGLGNSPNWASTSGVFKQLSGSMGRIIAVGANNQAQYGTKYDIAGSAFTWTLIPGSVTQVSFNYPMVIGLTTAQKVVYIDNVTYKTSSAVWTPVGGTDSAKAKTFNYVALSQGSAYGAGTDNKLWYCPDVRTPVWVDVSTGVLANIPVRTISFDVNQVVVVDSSNRVYFADTSLSTAPNWKELKSKAMKQVSIKNRMGVGVGADNLTYFSGDVKGDSWFAITGPTGNTSAELFFAAGGNMVTFRPATLSQKVAATTGSIPVYVCNSNEVLQNGVCVTKCPDGSYPDGELCQATVQVVPPSSQVKCTKTPYGTSTKWLCNSSADAATLLAPPSPTTTYVADTDQVCVADDPSTKMYYCVTGAEAKNNSKSIALMRNDFANTCNQIKKNYIDLSNNLTNLIAIQSGVEMGSTKLGTATSNLRSIYTQMGCSSATGKKLTLCEQIQSVANSVGGNTASVTTLLNTIIPQLQTALGSRDTLLGFKTKFQCP
jgi:hypothetical protein